MVFCRDFDADVLRWDIQCTCDLLELCGESKSHGNGEIAQR
jgi:hypothetical protein